MQRGIYHDDFLVKAQQVLSRQGDDFYSLTLLTYGADGKAKPIEQLTTTMGNLLPRYPIEHWLLQYVLQFIAEHRQQLRSLRFIIPLSLQTLLDGQFLPQLRAELQQYSIEAYQLIFRLKIVETIQHADLLQARLTVLYQMGCFIMLEVMDEQTINYRAITELTYDFLLVSAKLLLQSTEPPNMVTLTKSVVQLAQQQHKTVVVQDIDDLQQLRQVQQIGIDYWQGNYIAHHQSLASLLTEQRVNKRHEWHNG